MLIKRFALLMGLILGAFSITPALAQDATGGYLMTETEKEAIREIIKEYIESNPEVILKAVEGQANAEAQKQRDEKEKVATIPEGLYKDAPFAGDADGDITVVEFFDYNCGYCKRVINDIARLADDPDSIKIVFRELPILSETSEEAARFALAADKQGKYMEFHTKLMKHKGRINVAAVEGYAAELGLDVEKLKEDAKSQDVLDAIATNMEYARQLQVRGTPFFLIGTRKVPGAVGYTRLKSIIAEERAKAAGGA